MQCDEYSTFLGSIVKEKLMKTLLCYERKTKSKRQMVNERGESLFLFSILKLFLSIQHTTRPFIETKQIIKPNLPI